MRPKTDSEKKYKKDSNLERRKRELEGEGSQCRSKSNQSQQTMKPKSILRILALTAIWAMAQPLQAAPSNNNFSSAELLSGAFDTAAGTTDGATRQSGESPATGEFTVWYKWTAPSTGRVRFSVLGTDNDFESQRITAWTGSGLGDLTFLAHQEEYTGQANLLSIPVRQGMPINFCVAHRGNSSRDQGNFDCSVVLSTNTDLNSLNVVSYSVSDGRFDNATSLSGDNATAISYGIEFSQREAGEPLINPSFSSWWKWTATEDGSVTVSIAGSEVGKYFDYYEDKTFLAYNVDSFAEMVNADPIGGNAVDYGLPGSFSFNVTSGETYYIAAGTGRLTQYGFRGGQDNGDLGWRVMTLRYSPLPPPRPEINLTAPGRRVGRSFTASAVITNPENADRVLWRINGKPRLVATNGARKVTKSFRGSKQKKRRGSRKKLRPKSVGVSVAVYATDSGFESDSDARVAKSMFYKFR